MTLENDMEVLTWRDVKAQVKKLNPWFYQQAEYVKGVNEFKLIKISYPFGADIIKRGEFNVRIKNEVLPYKSLPKNSKVKKLLNYNWSTIPLGMILSNSAESHMAYTSHAMPYMLQRPGQLFSLLSIFDDSKHPYFVPELYSTKSGCRSMVLLPSIKDSAANERLTRRLGISASKITKDLVDQCDLFMSIINSDELQINWYTEILFFSKDFVGLNDDTVWFNRALLHYIWKATGFERFSFVHDVIWSTFLKTQPLSVRNDVAAIHTVKQLFNIALGEAPGYIPSVNNIAGPISDLIDVFLNIYRIRFHYPNFMELSNFDGKAPVYYSLQKPIVFYETPQKAMTKQTVNQLKTIKLILDSFSDFVLNHRFPCNIDNTPLSYAIKNTKFDFYHPKSDANNIIGDIEQLVEEDKRFMRSPYKGKVEKHLPFPVHSMFFHGCIRLTKRVYSSD